MGDEAIQRDFDTQEQRVAVCMSQWREAHGGSAPGVKLLDEDQGVLEGLAIPFGGPAFGNKDLQQEYFDSGTNFALDWFPNEGRPVLYEHGIDKGPRYEVIGRQIAKRFDPQTGIWAKAQIDKAHRYANVILEMAKVGLIGFSSGTLAQLRRVTTGGKIVDWPWVELSLTPRPANPYTLIAPEAVKHLAAVDLELPQLSDDLDRRIDQALERRERQAGRKAQLAEIEAALALSKGASR